jgi:hypothetical protein
MGLLEICAVQARLTLTQTSRAYSQTLLVFLWTPNRYVQIITVARRPLRSKFQQLNFNGSGLDWTKSRVERRSDVLICF